MQINHKKPCIIILCMLLINLVMASLLDNHIYYKLEKYLFDQYSDYLLHAKNRTHQLFADSVKETWQEKAILLAQEFNAECVITQLHTTQISVENQLLLKKQQSKSGLIDLDYGFIYYPLKDDYLVELGPVPFNTWLTFIGDWFSWTFAILMNLTLAYFYLSYSEKQTKKMSLSILNLPFKFNKNNKDIYDHINELKNLIVKTELDNQSRLLLQRDLLHGVAHEFRSPMARIQFALEMLEDSPEVEQTKLRQSMHTSLNDLDKLVKELLYYAKLKDTESAIQYDLIDLETLINNAINQVKNFYPNVRFNTQGTCDHVLYADKNLMNRMLTNLFRNAGRFATSQCKVSITSTYDELHLFIEDDGVGIPPGKTLRIFEPFTRLDPSRSRDSGGCGLGLAIVSSIVNKHGGNIEVVEGSLTGACFKITLPK